MEFFAKVDPLWHDNELWVNPFVEDVHDAMDDVSELIPFAIRWRKFTNSRWLSVGLAVRALVLSSSMGLEALMSMARADPEATDFCLRGFGRLQSHIKDQLCSFALALCA